MRDLALTGTLGERLRVATLIPQPTLEVAAQALNAAQLDAFATNKGILFESAARVPGSTVLDGRWGVEPLAMATAQGREAAMPCLQQLAAAAERAVNACW